MTIIILLSLALITVAGLWLQIGAVALVVAPILGLFFLLTIAPVFVESMEEELSHDGTSAPEPLVCADTSVRWGVVHISDR